MKFFRSNASMRAEIAELREQHYELSRRISRLFDDLRSMNSQFDVVFNAAHSQVAKNSAFEGRLGTLSNKLDNHAGRFVDLQDEVDENEAGVKNLFLQLETVRDALTNHSARLLAVEGKSAGNAEALDNTFHLVNADIRTLTASLNKATNDIRVHEATIDSMIDSADVDSLKAYLADVDSATAHAIADMDDTIVAVLDYLGLKIVDEPARRVVEPDDADDFEVEVE